MDFYNSTLNTSAPSLYITYKVGLAVWFWVTLTICILGTFFNILVMCIILTSSKLRVGSGILILHLLAAMASHCLVHMPFMVVSTYIYAPYQHLSTSFCTFTTWPYYICIDVVNWSLFAIGINRFVAIFFPTKYPLVTKRKTIFFMICIIWTISLLSASQIMFGRGGQFAATAPWGTCGVTNQDVNYTYIVNLNVAMPLTMLGVLYLGIFIRFRSKTHGMNRRVQETAEAVVEKTRIFDKRYRSAKVMFASYLWYSASLLPVPICTSLFPASYIQIPLLSLIVRAIFVFGYGTTPLVFLLMSADYRAKLLRIYRRIKKLRQKETRPETDTVP